MPTIIPIKELKNTAKLANLVKEADGPVFVTKNGYGSMVIMSSEEYERKMFLLDVYEKIDEAEADIAQGKVEDVKTVIDRIRKKHGL